MNDRNLCRAKRTDNGKWTEGNLLKLKCDNSDNGYMYYIIPEVTNGSWCKNNYALKFISPCFEVDPETICQYTGRTDKTGKKLFESNIVKEDDDIGVVKFGKYGKGFHYGFYIEWRTSKLLRPEFSFWNDRVTCIGNVFDNPELL